MPATTTLYQSALAYLSSFVITPSGTFFQYNKALARGTQTNGTGGALYVGNSAIADMYRYVVERYPYICM